MSLYGQKRVSRSAAAMSYFLLLTVFPLLICLNAMLGSMFPTAERFGAFAAGLLPEGTIRFISDYLRYVSSGGGGKILPAGLALMCTSSAAAFRSVHNVMADLRGKARFQTILFWPLSFLFSLLFLAAMYFAVLVVLLGKQLLQSAASTLRLGDFSGVWQALRFPLLFLILLTMFWGLYRLTSPKEERGEQLPGAFAAAAGVELLSALFSLFIGMSTKYALVYGSLASLIILVLWLYLCCTIVVLGCALNVVLLRRKNGGGDAYAR
ncbi:MAG: YihY/virulence factor BrkB family protein [Oscillospiraceae bacterium]|nr:YihY/virulence factor BrkB family protein [Oscillospiraceae bacterium]